MCAAEAHAAHNTAVLRRTDSGTGHGGALPGPHAHAAEMMFTLETLPVGAGRAARGAALRFVAQSGAFAANGIALPDACTLTTEGWGMIRRRPALRTSPPKLVPRAGGAPE